MSVTKVFILPCCVMMVSCDPAFRLVFHGFSQTGHHRPGSSEYYENIDVDDGDGDK